MASTLAAALTRGERRRLLLAHENGYLDATCRETRAVVKAHGLWCWRLKIPMVWFHRDSPRSGFGCLHLEMLTSPNMLTGAGEAALKALGVTWSSPHEAIWERVPLSRLDRLAHTAFRAVVQPKHYRLNRAAASKIARLKLVPRKTA